MRKLLCKVFGVMFLATLVVGIITACADSPTKYKVTYVSGNSAATGTAPTEADHEEGDKFKLADNTFTYTGYVFDGWTDGEKTYAEGDEYTMPAKDVTFTAKWTYELPTTPVGYWTYEGEDENEDPISICLAITNADQGDGYYGAAIGLAEGRYYGVASDITYEDGVYTLDVFDFTFADGHLYLIMGGSSSSEGGGDGAGATAAEEATVETIELVYAPLSNVDFTGEYYAIVGETPDEVTYSLVIGATGSTLTVGAGNPMTVEATQIGQLVVVSIPDMFGASYVCMKTAEGILAADTWGTAIDFVKGAPASDTYTVAFNVHGTNISRLGGPVVELEPDTAIGDKLPSEDDIRGFINFEYTSFDGWSTESSAETANVGATWKPTQAYTVLYAVFTGIQAPVVTFYESELGGAQSFTVDVTWDNDMEDWSFEIPANTIPANGRTFVGWYYYDAYNGGTKIYLTGPDAWREVGQPVAIGDFEFATGHVNSFYAEWEGEEYQKPMVQWMLGEGASWASGVTQADFEPELEGSTYSLTLPAADDVTPPTGKEFLAWSVSVDGSTATDYEEEGKVEDIPATGAYVIVTAKYKDTNAVVYTVKFMNGSTEVAVLYLTVESAGDPAEVTPIPENLTPTDKGYRFGGWKDSEGNYLNSSENTVTGDVTFEAQWTPINYSVKFHLTKGQYDGTAYATAQASGQNSLSQSDIPTTVTEGAPKNYKLAKWVYDNNGVEVDIDEHFVPCDYSDEISTEVIIFVYAIWALEDEMSLDDISIDDYTNDTPEFVYPEQLKQGQTLTLTGTKLTLDRATPATADGIHIVLTDEPTSATSFTHFILMRADYAYNDEGGWSNDRQGAHTALGFTMQKLHVGFSDTSITAWVEALLGMFKNELTYKAVIDFSYAGVIYVTYTYTSAESFSYQVLKEGTGGDTGVAAEYDTFTGAAGTVFTMKYAIGVKSDAYTVAIGGEEATLTGATLTRGGAHTHTYENGICTVCGAVCDHSGETGTCSKCGATLVDIHTTKPAWTDVWKSTSGLSKGNKIMVWGSQTSAMALAEDTVYFEFSEGYTGRMDNFGWSFSASNEVDKTNVFDNWNNRGESSGTSTSDRLHIIQGDMNITSINWFDTFKEIAKDCNWLIIASWTKDDVVDVDCYMTARSGIYSSCTFEVRYNLKLLKTNVEPLGFRITSNGSCPTLDVTGYYEGSAT